jgi:hypothetical protein
MSRLDRMRAEHGSNDRRRHFDLLVERISVRFGQTKPDRNGSGFHDKTLTGQSDPLGCAHGKKSSGESSMSKLTTDSRFPNPDAAYVTLVDARRGLGEQEAAALDARLVLILANHIGDLDVLNEAIALAKRN